MRLAILVFHLALVLGALLVAATLTTIATLAVGGRVSSDSSLRTLTPLSLSVGVVSPYVFNL